ncbi:MAG: BrnA antitoxin family protein [Xanthomonadaceae bacterium]|nr:BrnA antitoxin family protein [Xanthomonadaceae bacterium]
MKKKKQGSSVQGKLVTKKGKYIPHPPDDSDIDFSDIPEITDDEVALMKRVGRVGRPLTGDSPKVMIAIRLDSKILEVIRQEAEKKGIGYQTLMNTILEGHFSKKKMKKAG